MRSVTFGEFSQGMVLVAFVVTTVFTVPAAIGLMVWSCLAH